MNAFENPSDTVIHDILATPKTIAVVGCSPDSDRDSHQIAALLKAKGHRIIPVNPTSKEILGERCYASVRDIPDHVDMVDVFRRPEFVDQIAEFFHSRRIAIVRRAMGMNMTSSSWKAVTGSISSLLRQRTRWFSFISTDMESKSLL